MWCGVDGTASWLLAHVLQMATGAPNSMLPPITLAHRMIWTAFIVASAAVLLAILAITGEDQPAPRRLTDQDRTVTVPEHADKVMIAVPEVRRQEDDPPRESIVAQNPWTRELTRRTEEFHDEADRLREEMRWPPEIERMRKAIRRQRRDDTADTNRHAAPNRSARRVT